MCNINSKYPAWERRFGFKLRPNPHLSLSHLSHLIMGHTWPQLLIITELTAFNKESSRLVNWPNTLLANYLVMCVIVSSCTSQVHPGFLDPGRQLHTSDVHCLSVRAVTQSSERKWRRGEEWEECVCVCVWRGATWVVSSGGEISREELGAKDPFL